MSPAPGTLDTALHRQLGLSDQELRRELEARGLDPVDEAGAIREMIALALARQNAGQSAGAAEAKTVLRRLAEVDQALSRDGRGIMETAICGS